MGFFRFYLKVSEILLGVRESKLTRGEEGNNGMSTFMKSDQSPILLLDDCAFTFGTYNVKEIQNNKIENFITVWR